MQDISDVYFIGGAPCGGKSTAAHSLCTRYGFCAYELDKNLERYTHLGMMEGNTTLREAAIAAPQEFDALSLQQQFEKELEIYRQLFPYAIKEIQNRYPAGPILAEGTGFLPQLMGQIGVDANHYVCLIPTPEFQRARYRERPWVARLLEQVPEPEQTFDRWMARNALLTQEIRMQAQKTGYRCIITDDASTPSDALRRIEHIFQLTAG